jgi:hypothetical protein
MGVSFDVAFKRKNAFANRGSGEMPASRRAIMANTRLELRHVTLTVKFVTTKQVDA